MSYREVGHTTASGLTVGDGDQASGRVDVPGGGLQLSSAASQVFGKVPGHSETEHKVHQINCGSLLEEAKEEAKLQVKVLLCLQGKRSSLVDLQGHRCLRALLGGPPGNRRPRELIRRRLLLLRKIVVL